MAKKGFFRILLLVLISFVTYFLANHYWDEDKKNSATNSDLKLLGAKALDFTLPQLVGKKPFQLATLTGKPIILNFWASWCAPCQKEMPDLIALAQKLKPAGFVFVAIAEDRDWQTIDRFFIQNPKLKKAKTLFTILLDADARVATTYGSFRYPETYLINRDFIIDNKFVGIQSWLSTTFQLYYDRLLMRP